jgi:broad specificity phosphatase PhoE
MNDYDGLPKIYLARHCKTIWNLENRLIGLTDLPLCPEGIAEANANLPYIQTLGVNRIICSDLKRAYETAKTYADNLRVPLHPCPGLRELDHGRWNGVKVDELLNDPNSRFKEWFEGDVSIPIPEGSETMHTAQKRIVETMKKILNKYPNETLLVVMHKHIRSILRCALHDMDLSHFRENIDESIHPIEIPIDKLQRLIELGI